MLNDKLSIKASVRPKYNSKIIYIHENSVSKVREITLPYLHSYFKYKVCL